MIQPKIIDIPLYQDDRGSVYCAFDEMVFGGIQRTYIVENFSRGMIRAWHGHKLGDTYLHVINGAAKVAAYPIGTRNVEPIVHVVTARKPQLFHVPLGWYNGAMSLEDNTKILVYSTLTFADVKNDDVRQPHVVHGHIWEVKNR